MSLIEWVDLPNLGDSRGALVVAESNKSIPFDIKRLYYIFDTKSDVPRGFHAHKQLHQVAFCLKGKCKMMMDNGKQKQEVWLDTPNKGLIIPPMIWHEMHDFSEDCILLVLASEHYDEDDYIRDYDKFKNIQGLKLVKYDEIYLEKSWEWLNDKDIKRLTMTPNFTKEEHLEFFNSLDTRENYKIFGIAFNGLPIGACGLKNIESSKAELWLYIGNKNFWRKGFGRLVMELLEKIAKSLNINQLYLKVLDENSSAINLYEYVGYIKNKQIANYIIMEKDL